MFMDDRLYTSNTDSKFNRNVSNINPTVLENDELFYAANLVWWDAVSLWLTIMRLIRDGFKAILECFGPFEHNNLTQSLTIELISQTQNNSVF